MPGLSKWKVALLVVAGLSLIVGGAVAWEVKRLRNEAALLAHKNSLPSQLEKLYAACVKDMIASTCKVMGTSAVNSADPPAKPSDLVFVAGVGAISAVDYQQMYEAGDAMCSVVRDACAKDWLSSRCTTARKLLLPAGGSASQGS